MKKITKTAIVVVFIIAIGVSFFAGSYIKEQEQIDSRLQRCHTLITFAIDKVENQDISDQDVMEALISNVYAAYEFCDKPDLSEQLHNLWNTLVFEDDRYIGKEDVLITQLREIAEMTQLGN